MNEQTDIELEKEPDGFRQTSKVWLSNKHMFFVEMGSNSTPRLFMADSPKDMNNCKYIGILHMWDHRHGRMEIEFAPLPAERIFALEVLIKEDAPYRDYTFSVGGLLLSDYKTEYWNSKEAAPNGYT